MDRIVELKTERLSLRQWRNEDLPIFARLNADPAVMAYYPATLNVEESNALAGRFSTLIAERGWGFWAVETINSQSFIGFVGLHKPTYELPVSPCIEIGWRLAREYWGKGYATEAATAALEYAFMALGLSEVYAFTSVSNWRSRAVMERLRMTNMKTNFFHPMIPKPSPLSEHVLYKIDKTDWVGASTSKNN